jgi:hypothetical protein
MSRLDERFLSLNIYVIYHLGLWYLTASITQHALADSAYGYSLTFNEKRTQSPIVSMSSLHWPLDNAENMRDELRWLNMTGIPLLSCLYLECVVLGYTLLDCTFKHVRR